MKKIIIIIFISTLFIKGGYSSHYTSEDLKSRFILATDSKQGEFANVKLPITWWSRPFEYEWASKFIEPNFVVLDAACGIDHPFKWFLSENCLQTWACDIDIDVLDFNKMITQYDDETTKKIAKSIPIWENINFCYASICNLPKYMPIFDRIFCISTLEHMTKNDRKKALMEFKKKLSKNGLLIITVDYPEITPEELMVMSKEVGLVPAGDYDLKLPSENALNGYPYYPSFYIYRCVLKHDDNSINILKSKDLEKLNKIEIKLSETKNFSGGFSLAPEEAYIALKHATYRDKFRILEFGSGESTILFTKILKEKNISFEYHVFENDPNYIYEIENVIYHHYDLPNFPFSRCNEWSFYVEKYELPNLPVFDLVIVDGPHGVGRAKWYEKFKKYTKPKTVILIDDFHHYIEFKNSLDENFLYDTIIEYNQNPSWKIINSGIDPIVSNQNINKSFKIVKIN
jgi:hypothetical protein